MGLESSNISSVEDAESRAIVDTSSSDTTRWGLASSVLGGRQGQGTLLLSIAASVGGLFGASMSVTLNAAKSVFSHVDRSLLHAFTNEYLNRIAIISLSTRMVSRRS